MFLPELLILEFRLTMQHFKCKSLIFVSTNPPTPPKKDNFHNLIPHLDKLSRFDRISCML